MKHRENTCMDSMICMDIITYIKYIHNMTHTHTTQFYEISWYMIHTSWWTLKRRYLQAFEITFALFDTLSDTVAYWSTMSDRVLVVAALFLRVAASSRDVSLVQSITKCNREKQTRTGMSMNVCRWPQDILVTDSFRQGTDCFFSSGGHTKGRNNFMDV